MIPPKVLNLSSMQANDLPQKLHNYRDEYFYLLNQISQRILNSEIHRPSELIRIPNFSSSFTIHERKNDIQRFRGILNRFTFFDYYYYLYFCFI